MDSLSATFILRSHWAKCPDLMLPRSSPTQKYILYLETLLLEFSPEHISTQMSYACRFFSMFTVSTVQMAFLSTRLLLPSCLGSSLHENVIIRNCRWTMNCIFSAPLSVDWGTVMHLVTFLLSPYWNVVFPSIYLVTILTGNSLPYTFIEE